METYVLIFVLAMGPWSDSPITSTTSEWIGKEACLNAGRAMAQDFFLKLKSTPRTNVQSNIITSYGCFPKATKSSK